MYIYPKHKAYTKTEVHDNKKDDNKLKLSTTQSIVDLEVYRRKTVELMPRIKS